MLPTDGQVAKKGDRQETVHTTNGVEPRPHTNGFSSAKEGRYVFSSTTHAQLLPVRRIDRLRCAIDLTCRAIIRGYDNDAILSECCRHLVDAGGYNMAWAGLSSYDEPARIVPTAQAGLTVNDNDEATQLLQATTLGCIRKRTPQIGRSSSVAGGNSPQAPDLLMILAIPMELGPHGQGALALGSDDPDAFKPEEVAMLRDLANDLGHGISRLMDRTIAEQREERLLQDCEFHASLFNHTPEGAFVATKGGRLVQANPAFARSLGHRDAVALLDDPSASLYTIVAPKDKPRLMAVLEDDAAPRTHEMIMRRKDNTPWHVRVTVQPLQCPQGRFLQAFVHDLSPVASEQPDATSTDDASRSPAADQDAAAPIDEEGPTRVLGGDNATPSAPRSTPHTRGSMRGVAS